MEAGLKAVGYRFPAFEFAPGSKTALMSHLLDRSRGASLNNVYEGILMPLAAADVLSACFYGRCVQDSDIGTGRH